MPLDPMQALQGGLGAALQGMPPKAPQPPMGDNPMEGALMGESPGPARPQRELSNAPEAPRDTGLSNAGQPEEGRQFPRSPA